MKKLSKILALVLTMAMLFSMTVSAANIETIELDEETTETAGDETEETTDAAGDYHIGIVTGSVSQSEDDRRGAEAFQAKYGEDRVTLAIYPDNFTEELETTIQTIVNLSDDPEMKAIIVNQAVPGTTEAFRQIKERRPDILCIAGESHEDLPEIGSAADLV